MEAITLSLEEVCGKNIYTRSDGHILYDKIDEALKQSKKVIVDFQEKEIASESFLDEAIVEHYLRPISPNVAERLILRHVTKPDQALLGRVLEYRKKIEAKEERRFAKKRVSSG